MQMTKLIGLGIQHFMHILYIGVAFSCFSVFL